MSEWSQSTERMQAEVRLVDGVSLQGELHLQGRVFHHTGPESPVELLNRPEAFIPLSTPNGIVFVAKAQVMMVVCPPVSAVPDPERLSVAKLIGLDVVMHGGVEVKGWATLELPPPRARTLDFLNGPEPFFAISTDDDYRVLNRALVRLVRPLD